MKNFLILILLIALGVSVYFNLKRPVDTGKFPSRKYTDPVTLNFYSKGNDSDGGGGERKPSLTMQVNETLIDSPVIVLKEVCCPVPPPDTTAYPVPEGGTSGHKPFDISKLVRLEIKLPASKKTP